MPDQSDRDLLVAWRDGDVGAGNALFLRHESALHAVFRNKCAAALLPDLVQETFTRSLTAEFRETGSYRSFLCGIAALVLNEWFRKSDRYRPMDDASVEDFGTDVHDATAQREECRLLTKALRRLPVDQQIALEMQIIGQMDVAEIAEAIGVDYNTANGRIQKAKARLRQIIADLRIEDRLARSTVDNLEDWGRLVRDGWDAERRRDSRGGARRHAK